MGEGEQVGGGWGGVYDEVRFEHERCFFEHGFAWIELIIEN